MSRVPSLHPVSALVATLFSTFSAALVVNGLFRGEWWAAFGLVLFMTSILAWVALLETAEPSPASASASARRGLVGRRV
jgi:uncharacterized membrane protein YphA (DoxX/SURF4 family)